MALLDTTSAQLEAAAARMRALGLGELERELGNAIQQATEGIPEKIRSGLIPRLPNRYAETLDADLSIRTERRGGTVSIVGRPRGAKKRKLRRLDQGILEHPLYGNRRHWYRQAVEPGWFTRPIEDDKERMRGEIEAALQRVVDRLG